MQSVECTCISLHFHVYNTNRNDIFISNHRPIYDAYASRNMPLYFPLQLTPLSRLFPLEGTKYYLYIQCTCNKFKKCNASVANSRDTENLLDLRCDGTFV